MNIMKFRPLFFLISASLIGLSLFSITKWGYRHSEDFKGGATFEIKMPNIKDKSKIEKIFNDQNVGLRSLSGLSGTYTIKFLDIPQDKKLKLEESLRALDKDMEVLQFSTRGPSLGKELIKKTIFAIILSSLALLLFIGSRFSDFSFGAGAVLAMFHDSFILIGMFSLLGHFFEAELDTLFVTALLTTLSASVHDTVVTFDRIGNLSV